MSDNGIKRVKAGFTKIAEDIVGIRTDAALYAILSEGGALAQTMVPIDTGTLANSQYAPEIEQRGGQTIGTIGYTAAYAGAVHEMSGKLKGQPRAHFGTTREGVEFGGGTGKGNYWDPDAEPQFLTKGFKQLEPHIPAILERIYRV
ncbi:TPA: hypothetical protein ACVU5F_000714 [Vibrio parahaemolyticus]